jgi:hypothetical protein
LLAIWTFAEQADRASTAANLRIESILASRRPPGAIDPCQFRRRASVQDIRR